jgi:UDP-N-acetylmuramoylalanine--D-glutamate ligase
MSTFSLAGKRVLVIGLGISGRSAAHFLHAQGAHVHGIDRQVAALVSHPDIQILQSQGMTLQPETSCQDVNSFDLMVLSPGVSPFHPLVLAAEKVRLPVIGEIELGCRFSKHPIIGVTGTNGKTTVTCLIAHVLKSQRQSVSALGNIGIPFTKELLTLSPEQTIVLELSSYQLETLNQQALDAAVLLNITSDHLDRYSSMRAYAEAKCRLAQCLKPTGQFYLDEKVWEEYKDLFKGKKAFLYGYQPTSSIYTNLETVFRHGKRAFDLPPPLAGAPSHDLENLLAAYAICADREIEGKAFLEAWKTFKKPPHRIEFVCEDRGVHYYDDSKGTNIDAVMRAVQSLKGPVLLIVGGVDKGTAYTPWIESFKHKVKGIYAIGQAATKIHAQLSSHFSVTLCPSLEVAVKQASQHAESGDHVLLSPGCASFDMFDNYAHRGKEFQKIVRTLVSDEVKQRKEDL